MDVNFIYAATTSNQKFVKPCCSTRKLEQDAFAFPLALSRNVNSKVHIKLQTKPRSVQRTFFFLFVHLTHRLQIRSAWQLRGPSNSHAIPSQIQKVKQGTVELVFKERCTLGLFAEQHSIYVTLTGSSEVRSPLYPYRLHHESQGKCQQPFVQVSYLRQRPKGTPMKAAS